MPTLLRISGYVFSFFSNENNEPPHVHVDKGGAEGKIWLEPEIKSEFFKGFKTREKREIMGIVEDNAETFKQEWYDYFKK